MSEFYSPGQLSVIYPYLEKVTPKWLLLGGPADANEAQTAVTKWPHIRVVGVEVNPEAVAFQRQNGWPYGHQLICAALSFSHKLVRLGNDGTSLRHASIDFASRPEELPIAPAVTWNSLDRECGPFDDAVMWLDIEHSEWDALMGSDKLFEYRKILLVNVEIMGALDGPEVRRVEHFLRDYDFQAVKDWNHSEFCRDRIYVRRDIL